MQIERVTLRSARVALEPLAKEHLPSIASAIYDGSLWTIPVTFVPHPNDLESFLAEADRRFATGWGLAFAIFDIASGKIVGSTRFRNIDIGHRRVEIGFTFIAQSWQRSYINTEAKYLMLRHAFETWCCARVEFITDVLNTASRNAILRLGAKEEGIMRNHMIMRDGRHRDSVLFSVTSSEWPAVRAWFEAKVVSGQRDR
jgi:RimJ/RimL family protein N-acetyltransferase